MAAWLKIVSGELTFTDMAMARLAVWSTGFRPRTNKYVDDYAPSDKMDHRGLRIEVNY